MLFRSRGAAEDGGEGRGAGCAGDGAQYAAQLCGQQESGGDEAKILSTGFAVRAAGSPVGALPAPIDFLATFGDNPGEVDVTWSAVKGAKSYIVEVRENVAGTAWGGARVVTKSRATIDGLTTGKTYAFRVRAVGTAGEGPWSDESLKLAP